MLTSYHYAVLSVVLAQFGPKGFADGMEGVIRLVEAAPKLKASSGANIPHLEGLYLLSIKAFSCCWLKCIMPTTCDASTMACLWASNMIKASCMLYRLVLISAANESHVYSDSRLNLCC